MADSYSAKGILLNHLQINLVPYQVPRLTRYMRKELWRLETTRLDRERRYTFRDTHKIICTKIDMNGIINEIN